ncbi:MAG: aldo/keto reductase [Dehalococcoidia bacterium]
MQQVTLGKTGLGVSRLGVGLSEIGSELSFDDVQQAGNVLNNALDSGINFLDTSACYNISEELIGRTIANRRDEYILATKAGHVTGGYQGEPWTYQTVADSIDRSLERMKTDHVDLVQLHSCGVDVLEKGDVIRALQEARDAGKTRFIGYSGDNAASHWAVDSGLFDTLQTSFNLADQHARTTGLLEKAEQNEIGVIIKRPIANGAWRVARQAVSSGDLRAYASIYVERATKMADLGDIPGEPDDQVLLSLGFTFHHPQVDVAIVGTKNPDHMKSNIRMVEDQLPVDAGVVEELQRRFEKLDDGWTQRT